MTLGQNCVRNTAIKMAMGRAMARERTAVISVPVIGPAAPKTSVTGFHVVEVRKEKPNFDRAGQPPMISEIIRPLSVISNMVAAENATARKIGSARSFFGVA